MRRVLETPTFALSVTGGVLAGLALTGSEWATRPAIICLAIPGVGGVAIALYRQVQAAGEEWAWRGIVRAFRRPLTDEAKAGLAGHLPQALAALMLLWRYTIGRRREDDADRAADR